MLLEDCVNGSIHVFKVWREQLMIEELFISINGRILLQW